MEFRKRRREFRYLRHALGNNGLAMKGPKERSPRFFQVSGETLRRLRGAAGWTVASLALLYLLLVAAAGAFAR